MDRMLNFYYDCLLIIYKKRKKKFFLKKIVQMQLKYVDLFLYK